MNISKKSWLEKRMDKFPSKHKGTLFTLICILLVILQIVTQKSCMETLLPICIPWMYYQYVVLGIFLLPFLIASIRKLFWGKISKKESIIDPYVWKIIMTLIIVPAIIFLPNRYIPIEKGTEYKGVVVDQTTAPVNKSPCSQRNYEKIKIIDEDLSFWYCLNKDSKSYGSKCLISARRGIFGMRYIEKVVFLVE